MRFEDFADIIRREVGAAMTNRILMALCRQAPGEDVYIPKKEPKPTITPLDTVTRLRERHNISRSTAYNWVNQWKK